MSEEKRIYVHPGTISEMQEKWKGYDMEGRIKKLLDHYNQSPFREEEKRFGLMKFMNLLFYIIEILKLK